MENEWRMAHIKFDLDKGKKKKKTRVRFKLVHNLPNMLSLNIDAALNNWLPRTKEYTDTSLRDYINSKSHLTGCKAYTIKEYEALIKPKPFVDPNNRGGTGHYDDSLSDADPRL